MLIYLATRVAADVEPRATAVAIALPEVELERFKTQTADATESTDIATFITTNESGAMLAVATSRHWPQADALGQCLRGLYLRLRTMTAEGLRLLAITKSAEA